MDYFYIYVLRSVDFKRNYVGFTRNVDRRLKEHNSGKTKSTKPYRPWKLLFIETFISKSEALEREKYLKSGQGRDYIKNNWPRSITEYRACGRQGALDYGSRGSNKNINNNNRNGLFLYLRS